MYVNQNSKWNKTYNDAKKKMSLCEGWGFGRWGGVRVVWGPKSIFNLNKGGGDKSIFFLFFSETFPYLVTHYWGQIPRPVRGPSSSRWSWWRLERGESRLMSWLSSSDPFILLSTNSGWGQTTLPTTPVREAALSLRKHLLTWFGFWKIFLLSILQSQIRTPKNQ